MLIITEHLVFKKAKVQKDYEHSRNVTDADSDVSTWSQKLSNVIELLDDAHLCAPRGTKGASGHYSVDVLEQSDQAQRPELVARIEFALGVDALPLRHELIALLASKIEQHQLYKVIRVANC